MGFMGFQAAIVKSNQVLESPISWTFELQSILGLDPKGLRAKREGSIGIYAAIYGY